MPVLKTRHTNRDRDSRLGVRRTSTSTFDDPLSKALAPPPNESEAERAERLRAEAQAKHISDLIDQELNRQRAEERSGPKPVKILLLGQSESGKSTTLKNFQLMNSSRAFRAERFSWRAVVQLNFVRSVRIVLDAVEHAQLSQSQSQSLSSIGLGEEHAKLCHHLRGVLDVEATLISRLTPSGSKEIEASHPHSTTPTQENHDPSSSSPSRRKDKELYVTAGSAWKSTFSKFLRSSDAEHNNGNETGEGEGDGIDWDDPNDPTRVLHAYSQDVARLWRDEAVRALLRAQKLRLEELPGFFLDSIERVTSLQYIPSDDDILRARLRTLGVTEYRFNMRAANAVGRDWRVYDVGGRRSLRAAWVPFFDDVDAIIFLAPISCFDQVLAEDNSVNRLEDSVLLWRSIVSNPLLSKTSIILFLNKCDVLRRKLESGIRLGKYVTSYGERPNTFEAVSDYLRRKFMTIHKERSPVPRDFFHHFTSVTDTKTTSVILGNVTESVIRANLKKTSLA